MTLLTPQGSLASAASVFKFLVQVPCPEICEDLPHLPIPSLLLLQSHENVPDTFWTRFYRPNKHDFS